MTLTTTIQGALAPTIAMLSREFGTSVTVREQAETRNADGSTAFIDRKAVGFNAPVNIILTPITQPQAQRMWGQETEVTVTAVLADTVGITTAMRLTVESGPLLGQVFAVIEQRPEPIGGVVTLGLKKVA